VLLYTRFSGEADHEHTCPIGSADVHVLQRGTKYAAAHYLRMILANDDRPRCMHAEAEHTGRELLPELVSQLLDRQDSRRAAPPSLAAIHRGRTRLARWPTNASPTPPNAAPSAHAGRSRSRSRSRDQSYGLEL
jgi:hypothetical protein